MKQPETAAKKTCRVLLTVAAILTLIAGAILILAWRAASLDIKAAPYQLGAVQAIQTHDFSVELPADWKMKSFSGLIKWPDTYLVFIETWLPDREAAEGQFEHILGLAGQEDNTDQFTDISEQLGRAAIIAPRAYQPDGPKWQPVAMMMVQYPHGRLQLFQMGEAAPPDQAASDGRFVEMVREFLPFYNLDEESVEPGFDCGRTAFGSVDLEGQPSLVYSVNNLSFTFDGGAFFISGLTDDRRLARLPGFTGKLGRFFGELDRTGIISGSSFQSMPLDGRAGDETIRKHPYFDDDLFRLEMDWQASPSTETPLKLAPSFTMMTDEIGPDRQAEMMGLWRAILSTARFEKE